jgi:hypothetical protein
MKKQNTLNIKIRDLEILKDVWAGRRGKKHGHAAALAALDDLDNLHADRRVRGPIGFTEPQ